MNKELYEKLVKPNVVELDKRIDNIDIAKAEGKIEEYDYQKELYNILTEKFNIIENIALDQVNKSVKEFEEKENIKNNAEVRIVQYNKLQIQVKSSFLKITKALKVGKDVKNNLNKLNEIGIELYKNSEDIAQINKNIDIHKSEYTSNLPETPRNFIQKFSEYFSKERREYNKVLKDYQKMIKLHATKGNKLVKSQFNIEKYLLNINNNLDIEEKEFIIALKLEDIKDRVINNNKDGISSEKYINDSIGLIFNGILKQEIEKCILADSQINDNEKYIDYNNIYEKIEFAQTEVAYDVEKIDELIIDKSNFEIKDKINSLIEKSNNVLNNSNTVMASNINQILELINDIPKDKKNDYEQFITKMCGKYPQLIQK